jgi:alkylation response protein AidB-like acyl-CoA dehydrogenase
LVDMTYTFDRFLHQLETNWYDDDPVLQRLLAHYASHEAAAGSGDAGQDLRVLGGVCAERLRELAEESAREENRPRLRHFDPYQRRVDDVVLPDSTCHALRIAGGEHRLGVTHGDPCVFTAKWYLCLQNGEAGVGCSLACTDGMVRALERLGDRPVHAHALRRLRGSTAERYVHGAQFVTEIQGGSDAASNLLAARREGERWTLHGQKWFCSNINADYFLVTGRPDGAAPGGAGVALFLVPAFESEDRAVRNGYTIDRLKEKVGTRELATAEVTFSGAEAHPLGPLDRGLSNVVSLVLITSRFACLMVAAAFLRRAERIVEAYAGFRRAFGRRLSEFPLVRETLDGMHRTRERSLAAVFELRRLWCAAESGSGQSSDAIDFRCLLGLCKPALTREATGLLHEAMLLLGGNGMEERFSPLPRLWRDAVVMETWEGTHNVLITQAVRDLKRYEVEPAAFVARVAGEPRPDLARELSTILAHGSEGEAAGRLARLAPVLATAFGERALREALTSTAR